jgi:hypothetical protein
MGRNRAWTATATQVIRIHTRAGPNHGHPAGVHAFE